MLLIPAIVAALVTPRGEAADASPIRYVGDVRLVDPSDSNINMYNPTAVGLDPRLHALVAASGPSGLDRLFLIDTRTLKQQRSIDLAPFFANGANPVALDAGDHVAFIAGGQTCARAGCPPPQVRVAPLTGGNSPSTFTLPVDDSSFAIVGMKFVHRSGHRLLYAVLNSNQCCAGEADDLAYTTKIELFDADRLVADPQHARIWTYTVDVCRRLSGQDTTKRPYIGVSLANDFVYFACRGLTFFAQNNTESHSVVVVDFNSGDPYQQNPASFIREYHAFPGNMSLGFAGGDEQHQRLYVVVANGDGNRIFVFDAPHRAWTGSVPLTSSNVQSATADEHSGRTYVITELSPHLIVTDPAQIPVPQGHAYGLGTSSGQNAATYDPETNRLFVAGPAFSAGNGAPLVNAAYRVYEDNSPRPPLPSRIDPDSRTDDVSESTEGAQVAYSGAASGFGARLVLVGGLGGTALGPQLSQLPQFSVQGTSTPRPSGQDRFVGLGRVLLAQLTDASATANAVGLQYDEASASDFHNNGLDSTVQQNLPETERSQCGDYGGAPQTSMHTGSDVACDRDGEAATARAVEDRNQGGAISIGSGVAQTSVRRGKSGIGAQADATAMNIDLPMPNGGRIHIDEARNVADTVAHGRPGTARSTLTPTLKGVAIYGPTGTQLWSCSDCKPMEVAKMITEQDVRHLGAEVPRRDPEPSVTGSPKGAQAEVTKDAYAYWSDFNINHDSTHEVPVLQLTYYNDGSEASRLVVQLAGVFAESHFTIAAPPSDALGMLESPPPENVANAISLDPLTPPAISCTDACGSPGGGSSTRPSTAGSEELVSQAGFLHRPLGQTLLFLGFLLLFVFPLYLLARRREVLDIRGSDSHP
jgi:hypothetical protein